MDNTIEYTVRTPHADINKDTTYDLHGVIAGISTRVLVDIADADPRTLPDYAAMGRPDDADWDVYAPELQRLLMIFKLKGKFYICGFGVK